jgi:hypothetical protein
MPFQFVKTTAKLIENAHTPYFVEAVLPLSTHTSAAE